MKGMTLSPAETAALQNFLRKNGYLVDSSGPRKDGVDGHGGDKTRAAFFRFIEPFERAEFPLGPKDKPRSFCKDDPAEMIRYFGEPGSGQTRIELPFPMKLSWDLGTVIHSFYCHEKVADSLTRIYVRTLEAFGREKITALGLDRFGGCLNVRKKRGGSSWSTHAFGAAVDHWPERNQLSWDHTQAEFAKPVYEPFFEIVESEGWTSLGRARDFDWMHIQAPHL